MTPEIFSAFDPEQGQHILMVRSHGRTELFGPRIFRAPPHPDVATAHDTAEGAEKDCAKIRRYLAELPAKKISKKAARAEGA